VYDPVPPLAFAVKVSGTLLEPDVGPVTETVSEPPAGGVGAGAGVGVAAGPAEEMETGTLALEIEPTVAFTEQPLGQTEVGVHSNVAEPATVPSEMSAEPL
jgi:hypothetical protein